MPVNAGARLDRLPLSGFHHRIMWLIGAGMFFDGFDIYLAGIVLGATVKSGFSTLGQNAEFVSATFVGMMLGSLVTGFLGDRYGRRFTYQSNLAIFGFASLAAAFAPTMQVLILIQFVIGFGLGALVVWFLRKSCPNRRAGWSPSDATTKRKLCCQPSRTKFACNILRCPPPRSPA